VVSLSDENVLQSLGSLGFAKVLASAGRKPSRRRSCANVAHVFTVDELEASFAFLFDVRTKQTAAVFRVSRFSNRRWGWFEPLMSPFYELPMTAV
jgi:hypothetical protein